MLIGFTAGSDYVATPIANGAVEARHKLPPKDTLAGEWISNIGGTPVYYDFDPAGKKSFNGYVVGHQCVDVPGDIRDVAHGEGYYTGTENTFSSFSPCVIAGPATNTVQVSSDGKTAQWDSAGCSDCGPQTWTRAAPIWGFDTSQPANTKFLASKAITKLGHPRFVGQYLEYWQGAHDVITPAAVTAIHAAHARIMLIANPRVRGNDLTTSRQAMTDANLAVNAARRLHAPDNVAIFRDVENNYHITAAYVKAWVATITKNKYKAGFYENPRESGPESFTKAYCGAVQSNSAIPGQTVLFSDQPIDGTSQYESQAPRWNPASPVLGSCTSQTIAWQYLLHRTHAPPNADPDEALPGDLRYFW